MIEFYYGDISFLRLEPDYFYASQPNFILSVNADSAQKMFMVDKWHWWINKSNGNYIALFSLGRNID